MNYKKEIQKQSALTKIFSILVENPDVTLADIKAILDKIRPAKKTK